MKHYGFALALLALAGCQTMERHPRTTAFIAGSIALSAGMALQGRRDGRSHDVTTQPVVCDGGACR